MTPIRPDAFPTPASQPQGAGAPADAARAAAQRAFFDAAMGRSAAPASQAAPVAAAQTAVFTPSTAPVQRAEIRPAPNAEPPTKVLRPGSLLDIRV
ncbi:hypothetical protein [Phenylobacterium sp.]|uniref:hypothetical protein n=1 Tax=Phenylobacterium sp. TaxID=1871053 RepID=UPI002C3DC929|nr:hypothetical protein [Phenylobacterium sp.]HLZ74327.1 hypothetical protein [Phenylobacterium sp.]